MSVKDAIFKLSLISVLSVLLVACGQETSQEQESQDSNVTSDMIRSGSNQASSVQDRHEEARKGTAQISFENNSLDFGEIPGGNSPTERLTFRNTGDEPLTIYDAMVNDDAIIVEYPQESIDPGEEGYLNVSYNGMESGEFQKSIRLMANTESGRAGFRIKGDVVGGLADNGNLLASSGGGNGGNTDRYGRPPGHPHYGHNHPPRDGEQQFGQNQQQQQQQFAEGNENTDQYGRPPGHDHYGHDHPPTDQEQQQLLEQQQQAQNQETDEYGRSPDHDHYGHDHPPLDQEQQQQFDQQQAGDQSGETDEYGRSPGHDHYGHNHPPLDQEDGDQQIEISGQDGAPDGDIEIQQSGEEEADPDAPILEFNERTHDFGTIPDDTEVSHRFYFTNTGNSSLIINNVNAGCGCTAPSYSEEPVEPGGEGYVDVAYDSGFRDVESFNQSVTVESNSHGSPHRINVHGNVEK